MSNSPLLLICVPVVYGVVSLTAAFLADRACSVAWRLAIAGAGCAVLLALAAAVGVAVAGPDARYATALPGRGAMVSGLRFDALTVTMLLLVTTVAGIIVRFARRYLSGDPGQARFLRWFFGTVAAASMVVITNNLLVLAVAWTAATLALHQLLTYYADRPQAQIAAHKKFLLSRVADAAIFSAVALLWWSYRELELDRLFDRAATAQLPATARVAGILLVLGVSLRSAQLPFHGWLIQVMEAPTPVSALLHAGIVNIGGFILIRLAPLMVRMDVAQLMLVVIGTTTAVLAALVVATRVSVKVMLAWSTAAQMGFMLLECGLGAYTFALLHLVAHSVYKANAFLSSGRAVELQTRRDMATAGSPDGSARVATIAIAIATVALYVALHRLFGILLPTINTGAPQWLPLGIVATGFALLFGTQAMVAARPHGRLAQALYPACFAGFYLDEVFTRLTFRLWPPRTVESRNARARVRGTPVLEIGT